MHVRWKIGTSERRTCREVGVARSTQQYKSRHQLDDDLPPALIRPAEQYGRYGYRKVDELLRAEGWPANHKKVEWLWREEGLQLDTLPTPVCCLESGDESAFTAAMRVGPLPGLWFGIWFRRGRAMPRRLCAPGTGAVSC